MSTYTEKHKRYYEKNKQRIRERVREYDRIRNHEYYILNRDKKLAQIKASKAKKAKKDLKDAIIFQQIDEN